MILNTACTTGNVVATSQSTAPDVTTQTNTVQSAETTVPKPIETTAATEKPVETSVTTTTTATQTTTVQTTVAETTATTAETTTTTTEKPAPLWNEEQASGTMYVTVSCYSRKQAVPGAETVKLYSVNDKVSVTAKTDTGYYKLADGAFIHSDYLSTSKVTIVTTTTTMTVTEKPKPGDDIQQVNHYVFTLTNLTRLYDDAECTSWSHFTDIIGNRFTAVEKNNTKKVYKLDDGLYVKFEDVEINKELEKEYEDIYTYPFDFEAMRQYIINDAVNNYGLVYGELITKDESSWNAPIRFSKNIHPSVIRRNVMDCIAADVKLCNMKPGDYFNVYIETIPNYTQDAEGNVIEGYAIYFLR